MTIYAGFRQLTQLLDHIDPARPVNAQQNRTFTRDGRAIAFTLRFVVSQYDRVADTVRYCQFLALHFTYKPETPHGAAPALEEAEANCALVLKYLAARGLAIAPALIAVPSDLVLVDAKAADALAEARAYLSAHPAAPAEE